MSRILITLTILCGLFVACTKKTETTSQTTAGSEVNLAIWGNYLPPETQAKFEKETGIKINISNYSSNEELLAKIQMGSSGIDVAVPSDYMVEIMTKMNLLEPMDAQATPARNSIADQFLKQSFDPENKYSLPYTWTTTGIAYNKELYKGPIKKWKDLLANKDLNGKFALLDDARETTAAALKMSGYSVNTTKPTELKKAKETLLAAKKNVKMFTSDTIDILKNKEVIAAQAYSSDALQAAAQTGGQIAFVIPEEGSTIAIDNFVIIKGAKHLEAAHRLINFLLSHDSEMLKVKTIFGGPVLRGMKSHFSPEVQGSPILFPTPETFKTLERIHDLGESAKLYDELWTEVKTKN